jgi:hypothetical protein
LLHEFSWIFSQFIAIFVSEVFLIRKMSIVGSHLSASSIARWGPPVRALTPPGATFPCVRVDKATLFERRPVGTPFPSASVSASLCRSHPAASRRPASCVTPLPVTEPSQSRCAPSSRHCHTSSAGPLYREPLHRVVACELHDRSSHSARHFLP